MTSAQRLDEEVGMNISLTSVSVNDPIAAFKFYTEKLGFVQKTYMPDMLIAIVVSPDDPDGTALLLEPRGNLGSDVFFGGIYDAGLPVIVFGTKDIYADYERLNANGVEFRGDPQKTEWGTQVIFDDTCGNLIQLHQA
jgi:predicted enzyme related to lactoylglutathione lyase